MDSVRIITENHQLETLQLGEHIAFDLETTDLDPDIGKIRLLAIHDGVQTVIIDLFSVTDKAAIRRLLQRPAVAYNAVFDYGFLVAHGMTPQLPRCAMLACSILDGNRRSLKERAKQYLGIEMSKDLQKSDWSAPELSLAQLQYSSLDAQVAWRLWDVIRPKIHNQGLGAYFKLLLRMQPVVVHQRRYGIPFSVAKHAQLLAIWKEEYQERKGVLEGILGEAVNPRSSPQLHRWLEENMDEEILLDWGRTATGAFSTARGVLSNKPEVPLALALLNYREADKRLSCFGDSFVSKHVKAGRITPQWHIAGTCTGRFSSSAPNIQQAIGRRDTRFRACFEAPEGWRFVKADYNQAETRAIGLLSDDPQLLGILRAGADLHAQNAKTLGVDRQVAKTVFFGLLYGQGPKGLQITLANSGVMVTEEAAGRFQLGIRRAYPRMAWQRTRWYYSAGPMRTATGRTFEFNKAVHKPRLRYNYPVQGSVADCLLASLDRLSPHLSEEVRLAAHLHDEVILLVPEARVIEATEMIKDCMWEGWNQVFGWKHGMRQDQLIEVKDQPTW